MASVYLQPGDLTTYGLTGATDAQIRAASAAVDQITGRQEGLIWVPDATGAPAYMAAKTPEMSYALAGSIAAGRNVSVSVLPAMLTQDMVGDVLILDRATSGATEACVVSSVLDRGTLVLDTVRFTHAAGAVADQGLLITEERALPSQRNVTRVARLPCANLVGLQGRYGYGRRSDQRDGRFQDLNLLAAVQAFGGPPTWVTIDPTLASISPSTGEVWVPVGMLLATYSDVRLRYVAGYSAANLPGTIKQAAAALVSVAMASVDIPSQVKMYRAGDTSITRFSESDIPKDVRDMLGPYKARVFF